MPTCKAFINGDPFSYFTLYSYRRLYRSFNLEEYKDILQIVNCILADRKISFAKSRLLQMLEIQHRLVTPATSAH